MVPLLQEMGLPFPQFSLPLFFCTVFGPLPARVDLRPGLVENNALGLLPVIFLPDQVPALTDSIATGMVALAQGGDRNFKSEPPLFAGAKQCQHGIPKCRGNTGLSQQSGGRALPPAPLLPPHPLCAQGSPL